MPKYTVKDTTILHNGTAYGEGDVVEMTEKQAKRLSKFLTLVKDTSLKQSAPKADSKTTTKTTTAKSAAKKSAADTKDGSENGQDAAANVNGGSTDDK